MSDTHELTIVVEVSGNPQDEDPHEVANELLAEALDYTRYVDARKVNFVAAEWGHQMTDAGLK